MTCRPLTLVVCTLLLGISPWGWLWCQVPVNIIPKPSQIVLSGGSFFLDRHTSLQFDASNKELAALGRYFSRYMKQRSGFSLPVNGPLKKVIRLELLPAMQLPDEGYRLTVSPTTIRIQASSGAGIFYGMQSLLQTLPVAGSGQPLRIPCLKIQDRPRFGWRGLMLDVSRHFYPVEVLKEVLDLMALYKMNVFHWHLTDNEGWRIEIKKYPRLTGVGAWRQERPGSIFYSRDTAALGKPFTYGGYYTQQQVREIVAYAHLRHITVVPEIELPGHSGAALAAYPQYGCAPREQEVPNSATWNGRTDSSRLRINYCAGNDSVFLFLQEVLTEVMALFPSPYIHIGGDEVDKSYWHRCPRCQDRMKAEGLGSEEELQSYFVKRIEQFLTGKQRRMIGWDEILEGGLAPGAVVMSWRGEGGGIKAAKAGHPVILSPSNPLYFNRYQAGPEGEPLAARFSINTLERVYAYHPQPEALDAIERKWVLGGQAALWTEFISSREHLQYMLLPRLPALAEVLWSEAEEKDFSDFVRRLNGWHFPAWKQKGIRFHPKFYNPLTRETARSAPAQTGQGHGSSEQE